MAQMMIEVMPQIAAEIARPLGNIDNISIYDSGNGGEGGVGQVSGTIPVVIKQLFDTMSEATGVDMREIMRAQTYDAQVNRNVNITSGDGDGASSIVKLVQDIKDDSTKGSDE